jgi:integrin beta 3
MSFDGKAFGEDMVGIVRAYVARTIAPIMADNAALALRVAELEARAPVPGEPGRDGRNVDPEEVRAIVQEIVAELPAPLDGKDGIDGADGQDGRDGTDGKDADPELIRTLVAEAFASLPAPADGKDGADGRDGIDGKDGSDGLNGKDGAGIADLLIDREGNLVATMTDGRMKVLGIVVGRDGKDGSDGQDGDPGDPGRDGVDGKDGPGPGDFNMSLLEDGRTLRIAICRDGDDTEYAFQIGFPVPIDRGDFQEGKIYEEGDIVSHDGALWIARGTIAAAPPDGLVWRLAVPRGAPGADAYAGAAKGLFDPQAEYRALDVVSFNGCEWRAKCDNPGELPGDGWMLSAGKGKRGDRGERGADGTSIVASWVDAARLKHIITLADGTELEADLAGLARTIAESNEGGLVA